MQVGTLKKLVGRHFPTFVSFILPLSLSVFFCPIPYLSIILYSFVFPFFLNPFSNNLLLPPFFTNPLYVSSPVFQPLSIYTIFLFPFHGFSPPPSYNLYSFDTSTSDNFPSFSPSDYPPSLSPQTLTFFPTVGSTVAVESPLKSHQGCDLLNRSQGSCIRGHLADNQSPRNHCGCDLIRSYSNCVRRTHANGSPGAIPTRVGDAALATRTQNPGICCSTAVGDATLAAESTEDVQLHRDLFFWGGVIFEILL